MKEYFKKSVLEMGKYPFDFHSCSVKLDQNENPFDIPLELKKEIAKMMEEIPWSRYPPVLPFELTSSLSKFLNKPEECLLVGHGSNELILTFSLSVLEKGDRVVIPVPTFPLFEQVSKLSEANICYIKAKQDFSYDFEQILQESKSPDTKLIFLASPNNPTGADLSFEQIEEICSSTPALILLDEAYYLFGRYDFLPLLDKFPNLSILRTFSKAFGMAGIRVGYLISQPEIIEQITKIKLPFSVNLWSQVSAIKMLERIDLVKERVEFIKNERERVFLEMKKIPGIKVYPSHTNFLLFSVEAPEEIFKRLLNRGVLVRDVFRSPLLSKCMRVTIGLKEENDKFISALKQSITEH